MKKKKTSKVKLLISYLMALLLVVGNCQMAFAKTSTKDSVAKTSTKDSSAKTSTKDGLAKTNTKDSLAKIMNGPYLLAPKPQSMTVAWETDKPVEGWVNYGVDGKLTNKVKIKYELGTDFKNAKTYFFRATLKGLKPETVYNYSVELASGAKEEGSFKTLSNDPKKVKFLVISDTHKFESEKYFEDMIAKAKPDFILHTGDMVEGTGLQKDQYSFWLKGGAKFLRNIPVVYANGNHDDGPYYDDYFSAVQKKEFNSDETGRNISFNYAGIHFIMMDSCPWGLYEMNAVTSGNKVDEKTKKLINDSIKWLQEDLKSESAKKAQFRVIGMHHPYFDDFVQKNVVDVLEKNNVNLVLNGHLHEYNRNVSIDPKVGAKTVYITQGDGRIADGKINYGEDDERINSLFPEVVASGKSDFVSVTAENGKLKYESLGFDGKETKVFDKMTLANEQPKLSFSNISIGPDKILDNDNVTIKATVKNEGTGLAAAVMKVQDNDKENLVYLFGKKGKERVIVLNPGESKELTTQMPLIGAVKHKVKLADYTKTITSYMRNAKFEYTNLKTKLGQGKDSDTLYVKADVRNIGSIKGKSEVKLYVDNEAMTSKKIELNPLQRKTVEFVYKFKRSGSYDVKINNTPSEKVDIEGILMGTPIAKDLSGNNNDALLRGAPKLIKAPNGVAIDLDAINDYIEIPDNKLFRYKDGLTGMVWSNIDKLAGPDEYDHNPLLVKGPSVSYGVNYLYRMAVRRTGKLTYGLGYNNDNGEFFWNDDDKGGAQIGKWAQYTGAFDKVTGGISYLDKTKVGEIEAPSYDSPIKNWEGYPMFCGYSYHKHFLKNRGRGKYYTMLDAKIGQIRYYTTKLTQDEVKYINEHPNEKGPNADKLAVWLNFQDLNTKGSHVTEWRRPAEFTPAYKKAFESWNFRTLEVDADVPGKSSIKAVVEVSDDESKVKGSKQVTLSDGKQTIDISDLPEAQFVRIKTEFNSYMATDGTFIPQIREYVVSAANNSSYVETSWSTRADWEKGTLNGAAGFEPIDRFKNHEEDLGNY